VSASFAFPCSVFVRINLWYVTPNSLILALFVLMSYYFFTICSKLWVINGGRTGAEIVLNIVISLILLL